MSETDHAGRRRLVLLATAALLLLAGLVLAITAPGGPLQSNKAHAYGAPVPNAPTNPQNKAACTKYYGSQLITPEARDCGAKAKLNIGNKRCKRLAVSKRAACRRAVKSAYAKALAADRKQRAAEKACAATYSASTGALSSEDPDYEAKSQALLDALNACYKRARG